MTRPAQEVAQFVDEFLREQIDIVIRREIKSENEDMIRVLREALHNEVLENLARRQGLTVQ